MGMSPTGYLFYGLDLGNENPVADRMENSFDPKRLALRSDDSLEDPEEIKDYTGMSYDEWKETENYEKYSEAREKLRNSWKEIEVGFDSYGSSQGVKRRFVYYDPNESEVGSYPVRLGWGEANTFSPKALMADSSRGEFLKALERVEIFETLKNYLEEDPDYGSRPDFEVAWRKCVYYA